MQVTVKCSLVRVEEVVEDVVYDVGGDECTKDPDVPAEPTEGHQAHCMAHSAGGPCGSGGTSHGGLYPGQPLMVGCSLANL